MDEMNFWVGGYHVTLKSLKWLLIETRESRSFFVIFTEHCCWGLGTSDVKIMIFERKRIIWSCVCVFIWLGYGCGTRFATNPSQWLLWIVFLSERKLFSISETAKVENAPEKLFISIFQAIEEITVFKVLMFSLIYQLRCHYPWL